MCFVMRMLCKMKAATKRTRFTMGLLTLLVVFVVALSVIETTTTLPSKRHYCGRGLTTALSLLCNGVYNTVETLGDLVLCCNSRSYVMPLTLG